MYIYIYTHIHTYTYSQQYPPPLLHPAAPASGSRALA